MRFTEFWFLILTTITVQSAENDSNYIQRLINGDVRHCIGIYDCPPDGDVPSAPSYRVYISRLVRFARICSNIDDFNERHEVLPCSVDYTKDHCSQCADGFVQPDYISSSKDITSTKCFKPKGECHAQDVTNSRTQNTNTCVFNRYCQCDRAQCYHGDPCHCQKRTTPCKSGETMDMAGECVTCPLGTEKDAKGCGPCKRSINTQQTQKIPSSSIANQTTPQTTREVTEESVTMRPKTSSLAADYHDYLLSEQLNQEPGTKEPQSPLMIVIFCGIRTKCPGTRVFFKKSGVLSTLIGVGVIIFFVFFLCKRRKSAGDILNQREDGPLLPNVDMHNKHLTNENNNDAKNQENQIRNKGDGNGKQATADKTAIHNAIATTDNVPAVTQNGNPLHQTDAEENILDAGHNSLVVVPDDPVSGNSLLIHTNSLINSISPTPVQPASKKDFGYTETSFNSKEYAKGTYSNGGKKLSLKDEENLSSLHEYIVKVIDERQEKSASLQNKYVHQPQEATSLQEDIIKIVNEDTTKSLPIGKSSAENISSMQEDLGKILDGEQNEDNLFFKKAKRTEENISSMQEDIVKILDDGQKDTNSPSKKAVSSKRINYSLHGNSLELIDQNRPNSNSVSRRLGEKTLSECDLNPDEANKTEFVCKSYKDTDKEIKSMCAHDSSTTPKVLNDLNKSDSRELNINTLVSNNTDRTNETCLDSVNLKADTMSISTERGLYSNIQGDMPTYFLSSDRNTEFLTSCLERFNFNIADDKSCSTGSSVTKPKEEAPELLDSGVFVDDEKSVEQTGDFSQK